MASDVPSLRENLDRLLGIVRRSVKFVWIGAVIAVAGGAVAVLFAMSRDRSYLSETAILYREIIPTNMIDAPGATSSNRSLAIRFREVLYSRPLLEKVIEQNDLYPKLVAAGRTAEAIELVGESIKFRERGGNTFRISYRGKTPVEAQKVTANLAQLLLDWEKEIQLEAVTITREFFAAERERADLELSGAEYVLAQFLAEHPEFALEGQPPAQGSTVGTSIRAKQVAADAPPRPSPVRRRLSSPEIRALERQRDRLNQRLGQLATRSRSVDRTPPQLERARRDYSRAVEDLAELESRYTERHPDVIRARARVTAARSVVESLTAERASPLPAPDPAERESITKQLAEIDDKIAALRRRLTPQVSEPSKRAPATTDPEYVVELEAQHARLVRRLDELRDRYQTIESKWHTAEIAAASEIARQGTQLTIIDPAFEPMRPAGVPNKLLVALGAMASLGLGLVVVLALGSLDDRIFSSADLGPLDAGSIGVVIPRLGDAVGKRGRRG